MANVKEGAGLYIFPGFIIIKFLQFQRLQLKLDFDTIIEHEILVK